jgi:SAM-dependent methyltransferase
MIFEEMAPKRIQELLASCVAQHDQVVRLIVETKPMFRPDRLRWLLDSTQWAYAVNPNLIVNLSSKSEQISRANSILDYFNLSHSILEGKKFLDFGCGQGYVPRQTSERGAIAFGYDINHQWRDTETYLTDQWNKILDNAPYDFVMIYDVLDHLQDDHPIDCLHKIKTILAPEGVVYLRCHPWCSRTGNHSYNNKNKAYIHYFFTDEELEEMGASGIYTHKIVHPLTTYNDWLLKAGFHKIKEEVKRDWLEPFWQEDPLLYQMICSHWKSSYEETLANGTKFPQYQMEISFADYILRA